jgi:hypothetical protein
MRAASGDGRDRVSSVNAASTPPENAAIAPAPTGRSSTT